MSVNEHYSHVKPDSPLPEDYAQKHVYIRNGDVSPKFFSLMPGDLVEFTLKSTGKEKPQGLFIRVTGCVRRDKQTITTILQELSSEFTDVLPITDEKSHLILDVLSCPPFWRTVSECVNTSADVLSDFLTLLLTISNVSSFCKESFTKIVEVVSDSDILIPNVGGLSNLVEKVSTQKEMFNLLKGNDEKILRDFLIMILKLVPHKAPLVVAIIKPLIQTESEDFLYILLKHLSKSVDAEVSDMAWDDLPLVPSAKELLSGPLSDRGNLRPIRKTGSYDTIEDYFDVNFRLLRADCFESMCKCIQELMAGNLDERDMNVYYNIKLAGVEITQSENGFAAAVKLTPKKPVKNWDQSRNLMFGNLLCFSPSGKFNDAIWAVVKNRESMKSKGFVVVEFCSECNSVDDTKALTRLQTCGKNALAIESPTYYRAYQPVLKALQRMETQNFPFVRELVQAKPNRAMAGPDFIKEDTTFDATLLYENLQGSTINAQAFTMERGHIGETTLDRSQEDAIKSVLKNRIGIVQGPPGTGKTYIGVRILEILAHICGTEDANVLPVLVLTYKNHALDEFAKAALKLFPEGVARIGGRSVDVELKQCSLNELKLTYKPSKLVQDEKFEARRQLEECKSELEIAIRELQAQNQLEPEDLYENLDGRQLELLLNGCNWKEVRVHPMNYKDEKGDDGFNTVKKKYMDRGDIKSIIGDIHQPLDQYIYQKSDPNTARLRKIQELISAAFKVWLPIEEKTDHNMRDVQREVTNPNRKLRQPKTSKYNSDDEEYDERDINEEMNERLSTIKQKDDIKGKNVILFEDRTDSFSIQGLATNLDSEAFASVQTELLLQIENIWEMSQHERRLLVQHLLMKKMRDTEENFKEVLNSYQRSVAHKNQIDDHITAKILRSKKVVAMTITGASIHSDLLQQLKPGVVLVEEAAEVLEAQLLAAIGEWTKQIILIGDHKQLRPPVESYELRRNFNMDISMMERLVLNDFPHAVLLKQNRMRPSFAELLTDIYPNLQSNLARVKNNKSPTCMAHSYFFWNHDDPESDPEKSRSIQNEAEADRAVSLAMFFVRQGYNPTDITLLGAYKGQVHLLRKKMRAEQQGNPHLFEERVKPDGTKEGDSVQIHTIDLYQGDENEIVIVSLVRSNKKRKAGFLSLNRRCVAQSRAKCGLYFIGNEYTLSNSKDWQPLLKKITDNGRIGNKITLCCPKHRYNTYEATNAKDISGLGSFCKIECGDVFPCKKHACTKSCQPKHQHGYCSYQILFEFPECRHQSVKDCSKDIKLLKCQKKIDFKFNECGHAGTRLCHQSQNDMKCKELCPKILPCKHNCELKCWEKCDPGSCKPCEKIRKAEEDRRRKQEEQQRKIILQEVDRDIGKIKKSDSRFFLHKLQKTGNDAADYFMVEDLVTKYIQPGHNWYPVVTEVMKIVNTDLELGFLEAKKRMCEPGNPDYKFHGTAAAEAIAKEGFRMPTGGGMYGSGIYFASDSSKSAQQIYTKGKDELLLCHVLLGRKLTVEKATSHASLKYVRDRKCDSIYAKRGTRSTGGVLYDEFVVFDPNQAIPRFIIRYKAAPVSQVPKPLGVPSQFKKTTLVKKRSHDPNDPFDVHYRIAESQFLRLMHKTGQSYDIKSIEYYENPHLMLKFQSMENKMEIKYKKGSIEASRILGFHGTKAGNIDPIVKNNFDLKRLGNNTGNTGAFGAGIYFSENPSTSIGYGGSLLLCNVLPGKTYECKQQMVGASLKPGYDSHGYKPDTEGRYHELVIFNSDQILPSYVIRL